MSKFCSSFSETLGNEAEADSDDTSNATDLEQEGSSSSEESAANIPVAQKRKNEFIEGKEQGVKHKSVSIFIHFFFLARL
jgi:hypothetical protein